MKANALINFSVDRDNKKINVERQFAAPVSKVWAAFTESEILDRWWAPKPWQAKTKSMDFNEGGYWLYAMVGPDGTMHWARLDYKSITSLKSFSGIDAFCDEDGNVNHGLPSAAWAFEFSETNNTTTVSVEIEYGSVSDLEKYLEMGFKEGFAAALENLDALFETEETL